MVEIYFLARHIPFWATAMLVLGAEFGYLFWLRKKKKTATLCLMLALIGAGSNAFYIWVGGPERAVTLIKKMHRDHR
jgi:hypothetical protein